ncbi:TSCPD domain-containing protein [Bradyrhizobium sp. USDA 4508]
MPDRHIMPMRRRAETFGICFSGFEYTVTTGYFESDELGEIFIVGGKSGQAIEAIARDAAVVVSMLLQYGCPLERIRHAITRDSQGCPSSILGAVVDRLMEAPA